MYSAIKPSINVRKPKTRSTKEMIVPKPAKGTPMNTHVKAKAKRETIDMPDSKIPQRVINFNGIYECEKMPLNARSITFKL
jgi:hypothetical protein